MRIRCHGDLHLGQILFTGRDFMIIDFEGEPARSLGDRRVKRSPLRDVAGVLRSFHYATFTALIDAGNARPGGARRPTPPRTWRTGAAPGATPCRRPSSAATSRSPATPRGSPRTATPSGVLLDTSLLEKAVYELTYELNNRPTWVSVALMGIADLVGDGSTTGV